MASLQALLFVLFLTAIAFQQVLVDATIYKSMYITWGAHQSAILGNGDDLQLVLDQSSGKILQFIFYVAMLQIITQESN